MHELMAGVAVCLQHQSPGADSDEPPCGAAETHDQDCSPLAVQTYWTAEGQLSSVLSLCMSLNCWKSVMIIIGSLPLLASLSCWRSVVICPLIVHIIKLLKVSYNCVCGCVCVHVCAKNIILWRYYFWGFLCRHCWSCKAQCAKPCWWDMVPEKWPLLL